MLCCRRREMKRARREMKKTKVKKAEIQVTSLKKIYKTITSNKLQSYHKKYSTMIPPK